METSPRIMRLMAALGWCGDVMTYWSNNSGMLKLRNVEIIIARRKPDDDGIYKLELINS